MILYFQLLELIKEFGKDVKFEVYIGKLAEECVQPENNLKMNFFKTPFIIKKN
jgi:hypothetical protein